MQLKEILSPSKQLRSAGDVMNKSKNINRQLAIFVLHYISRCYENSEYQGATELFNKII